MRFNVAFSLSLALAEFAETDTKGSTTTMHWLLRPATALLPALLIGLWSAEGALAAPIATAGAQLTAQDWNQHVVQKGGTW